MIMVRTNNFPKTMRMCSRYLIDSLFEPGGNRSFVAYPMRLVVRMVDLHSDAEASVRPMETEHNQLLISVPKRLFKHAVDRNRIKRQIREAYRTNRHLLRLPEGHVALIGVMWIDAKHHTSAKVTQKMCNLLHRVSEAYAEGVQE